MNVVIACVCICIFTQTCLSTGFFAFVALPLFKTWSKFFNTPFSKLLCENIISNKKYWDAEVKKEEEDRSEDENSDDNEDTSSSTTSASDLDQEESPASDLGDDLASVSDLGDDKASVSDLGDDLASGDANTPASVAGEDMEQSPEEGQGDEPEQ